MRRNVYTVLGNVMINICVTGTAHAQEEVGRQRLYSLISLANTGAKRFCFDVLDVAPRHSRGLNKTTGAG